MGRGPSRELAHMGGGVKGGNVGERAARVRRSGDVAEVFLKQKQITERGLGRNVGISRAEVQRGQKSSMYIRRSFAHQNGLSKTVRWRVRRLERFEEGGGSSKKS